MKRTLEEVEELEDLPTEEIDEDDGEDIILAGSANWQPNLFVFYGPDSRSILLTGEINEELSGAICSQIQELSSISDVEPIHLYINTGGGNLIDAFAIYDCLRSVPNPIVTIVNGGCYSAGTLILMAGDVRVAMPNSSFFYHEPIVNLIDVDSPQKFESMYAFYKWCRDRMDKIVRKRTGLSKKKWNKKFSNTTSYYFDSKEATKNGFIDAIMEFPVKPEIKLEMSE